MNGTENYNVDNGDVLARGWIHSQADLESALKSQVKDILSDSTGQVVAMGVLSSLGTSQFDEKLIRKIMSGTSTHSSKRVGEALGEHFLVSERNCEFPFPMSRDQRNPNASAAGADLVGFQSDSVDNSWKLAFGEVKTSSENKYPPSVTYGDTGLKAQLEGLRDQELIKTALVVYLTHKCTTGPHKAKFKSAVARYFKDKGDISIFGIMVRDVAPNQNDLLARASSLSVGLPPKTTIELRAMYLPQNCLATITSLIN